MEELFRLCYAENINFTFRKGETTQEIEEGVVVIILRKEVYGKVLRYETTVSKFSSSNVGADMEFAIKNGIEAINRLETAEKRNRLERFMNP